MRMTLFPHLFAFVCLAHHLKTWASKRRRRREVKKQREQKMAALLQRLEERPASAEEQSGQDHGGLAPAAARSRVKETRVAFAPAATASERAVLKPRLAPTQSDPPGSSTTTTTTKGAAGRGVVAGASGVTATAATEDKPAFLRAMEEREARRQRLKEERLARMAERQREAQVWACATWQGHAGNHADVRLNAHSPFSRCTRHKPRQKKRRECGRRLNKSKPNLKSAGVRGASAR